MMHVTGGDWFRCDVVEWEGFDRELWSALACFSVTECGNLLDWFSLGLWLKLS